MGCFRNLVDHHRGWFISRFISREKLRVNKVNLDLLITSDHNIQMQIGIRKFLFGFIVISALRLNTSCNGKVFFLSTIR